MAFRKIPEEERGKALYAYASHRGLRRAAREAGINASTLLRWTRDPRILPFIETAQRRIRLSQEYERIALASRALTEVERRIESRRTSARSCAIMFGQLVRGMTRLSEIEESRFSAAPAPSSLDETAQQYARLELAVGEWFRRHPEMAKWRAKRVAT